MTRTKRMTAAVLTLVLLLNFAGCGAKNALFDQVSGAGKFAAESLTIYEEKGSFAAEPKTVRDAKQAEEIFWRVESCDARRSCKDGRQIHAVYFYICGRKRQQNELYAA